MIQTQSRRRLPVEPLVAFNLIHNRHPSQHPKSDAWWKSTQKRIVDSLPDGVVIHHFSGHGSTCGQIQSPRRWLRWSTRTEKLVTCEACKGILGNYLPLEELVACDWFPNTIFEIVKKYIPIEFPDEVIYDIMMDAVLSLYNTSKGPPRDHQATRFWIRCKSYSILRKMAGDVLLRNLYGLSKRKDTHYPQQTIPMKELEDPQPLLRTIMKRREYQNTVEKALLLLMPQANSRYVQIFQLMCDGYTLAEISRQMGVSRNRAASLTAKVRDTLRKTEMLSHKAKKVLTYIMENPWSTDKDVCRDLEPNGQESFSALPQIRSLLRILVDKGILERKEFHHQRRSCYGYRALRPIPIDGLFGFSGS